MISSKVLIVPSKYITNIYSRELARWKSIIGNAIRMRPKDVYEYLNAHMLCTEHYHYADIAAILGKENVYIVGNYYREYVLDEIPENTRYPSLHKTPSAIHCSVKHALSMISDFDVVIIGVRSGEYGNLIRKEALKKGVFVVILDYFDHVDLYADWRIEYALRGLKYKDDFDLYFKHDLPCEVNLPYIMPLAPMPCRLESYRKNDINWETRDIPVCYSGRDSHGARSDREELVELVRRGVNGAVIKHIGQGQQMGVTEYLSLLYASKIALSPSGKVWDSTRHSEIGLCGCAPVLPVPDCKIVGDPIMSDVNAITYEYKLEKGVYSIKNKGELIDKISYYLNNDDELEGVARKWSESVMKSHTTYARSEYVLNEIGKRI